MGAKGKPVSFGSFVTVATPAARNLGIGKILEVSRTKVIVGYFDVPSRLYSYQLEVDLTHVRSILLPAQTRVFYNDDVTRFWQVGRVLEDDGESCLVAFPNNLTRSLTKEQVHVRWRNPIANPVEFLIHCVTETPYFSVNRSRFVRAITSQRASCRGMGALLSSSVQLVDYQFNVVRKVLQDPVQRYLLSDEVGLGKSIEAGLLIRQYTIDVVDARILVIVPPPLVAQWRRELSQKFRLHDWLDDHLWIIPSDDLGGIEEVIKTVGMLVIDEAHHLSRKTSEGTNPLYELLCKHAPPVARLLLLSGTPVLADTEGFLRILHLLDPVVFPLDDLAGFERRVQSRQLVAEIAASLHPQNMLSMEDDLDRLRDTFGDDLALMNRVDALRPIVRSLPEDDDALFLAALSDLRAHLSETYKLHRRVIRNRRKSVPWATPQRKGLQTLAYACRWQAQRNRVIDDLRVYLLNGNEDPVAERFLFESAVHPGKSVSIETTLTALGINDMHARDLARQADELKLRSDDAGERVHVTHSAIRDCLLTPGVQVVVFCDESNTADRLTASISAYLGKTAEVLRHCSSVDRTGTYEDDEVWRRFLSDPDRCRVLVCDVRAEEGLNLHGGHKVALHYDLPPTPHRIEQRLGRLDRFGKGDPIRSFAPVCSDDAAEVAWVECLAEGLQVFNGSIASLQYLVEDTLNTAVHDWYNEGVVGLLRWRNQLSGSAGWVARERRRIDQQDCLDAMGDPQSEEFEHLEDVDSQWREWRSAFDGFALNALLFNSRSEAWTGNLPKGERVFRLNYSRDDNRQTLLSMPEFVSQFLGTIDTESRHSSARSPLTYPYAYSRHTVISKEGQSRGLRSLRYGDPLVESLTTFCQSDDRGRAFAMWRYRPAFEARDASGCDLNRPGFLGGSFT